MDCDVLNDDDGDSIFDDAHGDVFVFFDRIARLPDVVQATSLSKPTT